jgi:hypothetical protein
MHGNLEPDEKVLSNEGDIKWDIEELKNAYIRNAEEYDRLMGKDDAVVND